MAKTAEESTEAPEFRAMHRHARIAVRKVQLVLDTIRGKGVNEALDILRFSRKRAAWFVNKVLKSAVANADQRITEKKLDVDVNDLYVAQARGDRASQFKRWHPRARGMAYPILRRSCHILLALRPRPEEPEKAKGRPGRAAKPAGKPAEGRAASQPPARAEPAKS